ncbi:hypothetical protein LSTR_LSTR015708 [Laodelphax striatellus]|uniref:Uncharacterized protein n=1 Tax=Laodelphax striatellus TaxID=195883 RepID=A0A482WZJ1_LAOST|nr:hypothetical protein LSTR_LSTR015708 [Laodelphax striatellus]
MLHSLIRDDIPPEKSEGIVQTVLELWDRTYQYWIASTLEKQSMGPKVTSTAVFDSWGRFVNGFQKTPELISIDRIKSLLMDNMAVLSSSFDSLWLIVKGNISLLFYGVTTFFSVIISHGAALLGFFINMIIFLTALFYLLNSSRELYKPVEILTNMIPQYGNTLQLLWKQQQKRCLLLHL